MRSILPFVALALILLATPLALADEISGHSRVVAVTDQNKHTAATDSGITFVDYQFAFSGNAPDPNSPNPADRVDRAWILLVVDHQFHTGQFFVRDAVEDNSISYKVTFNGMTIQYDSTLHVEDSGWDIGKLLSSLNPFSGGDHGFGQRGFVSVHYLVYNETGSLVADETETEPVYSIDPYSLHDTNMWMSYENGTFTVTPVFISHQVMPRYFHDAPQSTPGQVSIRNVTYQTLEIQVTASKTLEDVTLAYGFGKAGNAPGYTIGSLLHDAATTVGSLLGGAVNAIVDFVFKFVPYGDKILFLKEFVGTIVGALWEILLQDPLMAMEDAYLVAVMYGLLLFIDPAFKHVFTPIWALVKGTWKAVLLIWTIFLWIVRFIVSKIPTGGG